MKTNELKDLFGPNKLKTIYEDITQIDPERSEFKGVRGKLLLLVDWDITEDILIEDPKREVFSRVFAKQIEAIIVKAMRENKETTAILQEQIYFNEEASLHLLGQIEKTLKLYCGEKGKISKRKLKLKDAWGMKNYLKKINLEEVECKILELLDINDMNEESVWNHTEQLRDWLKKWS